MKSMSIRNRIILTLLILLAAYQVVFGLNKYEGIVAFYFTISFGVLIIAGILLVLFGFEILESPAVVMVAALIPLGLSLGFIRKFAPSIHLPFLLFAILSVPLIFLTRWKASQSTANLILSLVHAISGIVIFFLPLKLVWQKEVSPFFLLVTFGGALIGILGLLLALDRAGRSVIPKEKLHSLFPIVLLLATLAFVFGMMVV